MGRIAAAILLVAVLFLGGGLIATTAYQAGVSSAVAGAGTTATVVAPVVVHGWGWGWGFGSVFAGFFGFLFFLFVLFLVFGLIRAILWGGHSHRGWAGRGWGPGGPGDRDAMRSHWESRAHDTFETWHREAHQPAGTPPTVPPASTATGEAPGSSSGQGPTMG